MKYDAAIRARNFKYLAVAAAVAVVLTATAFFYDDILAVFGSKKGPKNLITKAEIAKVLGGDHKYGGFPGELDLSIKGRHEKLAVQYSFDTALQESMEGLFRRYQPDYGAFVALDPASGRVLSMVSYTGPFGSRSVHGNLSLKATFPAASVFKVVTAAAAIAEQRFSADTLIPFTGSYHTLYKSNVLKQRITPWTRYMSLKDAFAHSVNSVFGKIGVFTVGANDLRQYATRFGFNRAIAADVQVQEGRAVISEDPWPLAESAAGFTRENTMSPLQAALIAAAVVNDGVMMEPFVVSSAHRMDGDVVYQAEPVVAVNAVDASTASEIRRLMRETVHRGTSRGTFRGFFRGALSWADVGGKTGSLTGHDPYGKYDWFVGFAESGGRKIAVASLSIHGRYWKVKASYLARKAFEEFLGAGGNPAGKIGKRDG
ncbi:MAG: hypothetical protein A2583_08285 [Bdellovibrionales bacterium RIFOXYD1_FULL_53_11]|nr:MAG: hypothetical protein A2583_08285 [Bdellovibrionales bacterium RIFOXYD1_FULL_53_11]